MQAIKSELLDLLRRNDLLRACLLTSKIANNQFSVQPYAEKVLEIASVAWNRSSRHKNDMIARAEAINYALFKDFGLEGKSERSKQIIDDPTRFYMDCVLEKRLGSPLAIAILYLIIAEQVGMKVECLALPSYYLLRAWDKNGIGEFYIDPFDSGRFLTQEEFQKKFRSAFQKNRMISSKLYEKTDGYQLVARLIQQLKHIYILKGNALDALRAVELLTALYPESPEHTRDRGILYCEMEYFSKAIEDLKFYLKQRPQADDVAEIKKLASMLKGYREVMN